MVGFRYPKIYSPEIKEKMTYLDATLGVRMYTCRFKPSGVPWAGRMARRGFFARKMTFLAKNRLRHLPLRSNVPGIFSAIFFVVC